jgi:type VI secretion system protein VasG
MSSITRAKLFGKLNSLGYKSIEGATTFCKLRGNPMVEMIHWVHQILQNQDSDLHRIIRHFELDASRLASNLTASLDALPRGASSISGFSEHLEDSVEKAWSFASLAFGAPAVRTGHLVMALLNTRGLEHVLISISGEFKKIKGTTLIEKFDEITSGSPEESLHAKDGSSVGGGVAPGEASGAMAPAQMGKQEALKAYGVDLTERARSGSMDPIVGRDDEIRQIVDILMRRRQNNPILTGEAGVGKTAVVEGLAQYIVRGLVPPALKDVSLWMLDLGLLQAGASMKGEFENRLRQVIEEVQSSAKPIILFIDEAHTLIGAGGSAGQNDAANLLKPALARGTLRTVAATTWAEYKKYFEKDPALTRRFQVVKIDEPSEEKSVQMLRGLASVSEKHHRVQVLDEALEAAVHLSHRYIPSRQLPDKAVSLLDTSCARVAISQHAVPAAVDDCRRSIEALDTELDILDREERIGMLHTDRRARVVAKLEEEKARLAGLEANWQKEKGLVDQILEMRAQLRSGSHPAPIVEASEVKPADADAPPPADVVPPAPPGELSEEDRAAIQQKLHVLQAELSELQGENPLILPCVDAQAVATVVADWTGIPVGRMVKNEIEAVLRLADTIEKRVVGQRHALDLISKRINISRAGLENPTRPIGVFLLAGPSGVGKTETALSLAEGLYGGEQNLITINMSEFQEAHTVSTLKGSPPGYVGYGEGGVLTEAVRRKPYSVVLLDEIEKAHPDVHEIFFQVFDKGNMEDGEGRSIDFKNTIILLTSNVGSDLIMNMCKDPDLKPDAEAIAAALREPMLKVFPAALLGRVQVIPYYPLSDEMIQLIIRINLKKITRRLHDGHEVPFTYSDEVVGLIAQRCTELESGARMIEAIMMNTMLPTISREILTRMMEEKPIKKVAVDVKDGDLTYEYE